MFVFQLCPPRMEKILSCVSSRQNDNNSVSRTLDFLHTINDLVYANAVTGGDRHGAGHDHLQFRVDRPVTGRLHQVRVHLDSISSTVLGDEFYGPDVARRASSRLALHAHRVAFNHPITGEELDVHSPFPKDLRSLLTRMHLHPPPAVGVKAAGNGLVDDTDLPEDAEELAGDTVGDEES